MQSWPDRVLTTVEREGRPAVAVFHDPELAEDPELVHAAGAMALLARENAELEAGWNEALRELSGSRARIAEAAAVERRALERDLHDGAQQQLTAVLMKLSLVRELVADESVAHARIVELEDNLESALQELRRLGHGIYPAPLAEFGLVGALEAVARASAGTLKVSGQGVGRYPAMIEAAVYFCCLEAVQNATKHADSEVHISIRLQLFDARSALRGRRRRLRASTPTRRTTALACGTCAIGSKPSMGASRSSRHAVAGP